METTIGQSGDRLAGVDPAARSAELADARRRASVSALQSAAAAEARRAEQRAETRAIIEHAIGANTRLSIARNDAVDTFVYRAIDRDTGEVVHEWPPVQFARFLEQSGVIGLTDEALMGLVIDEEA